jgi:hypothetical protein
MSSTKVEYMVASQSTRQKIWLSSFFGSTSVPQMKPIVTYDDNQNCIYLLNNPIFHACMKHIKIHHHLV